MGLFKDYVSRLPASRILGIAALGNLGISALAGYAAESPFGWFVTGVAWFGTCWTSVVALIVYTIERHAHHE